MDSDRIGKLEDELKEAQRELKHRSERIDELKREVDEQRDLIRRMEEHLQDGDVYLEDWISTFGMVKNADDYWRWDDFVDRHNKNIDDYEELRAKYNKLVGRFNKHIARLQPIGRPLGASEAQEADVVKRHKRGESLRNIAEETNLGLRTVRTIVGRANGTDRTTVRRRMRLGLEPKPVSDLSRQRSIKALPRRVNALLKDKAELLKEAKGLK